MIDWWGLGRNAVWILGLALATVSVASFLAGSQGLRLGDQLSKPSFEIPLSLGLALFCLGLFFSSRTWWERALWGVAATSFGGLATLAWWRSRSPSGMAPTHEELQEGDDVAN